MSLPARARDALRRVPWPRVAHYALLALVLGTQLFFGTHLYRENANWFAAPDDVQGYWYTDAVAHHGLPLRPDPLPLNSTDHPIRPRGTIVVDGQSTIYQGLATFYLYLPFYLLGFKQLFLAPAVYGVAATLAVYAIARRTGSPWGALAAATLFGLAAPTLFWSNFLFSNTLGTALLLWGVAVSAGPLTRGSAIAAMLLLVLSGFVRAEMWVLAVLYLAALLAVRRKEIDLRLFGWTAGAGAAAAAVVFGLTYAVYHNFSLFASLGSQSPTSGPAVGIAPEDYSPLRALLGKLNPGRIFASILRFGARVTPLFLVGPVAAVVVAPRAKDAVRRSILIGLGLGALFMLVVFGGNPFNAGAGITLAASYVRYFLPLLAGFAVAAGWLVDALAPRRRVGLAVLAAATVLLCAVSGCVLAMDPDVGVPALQERLDDYRALDGAAKTLPAGAVVVGDYPSRIIISRPVLSPEFIPPETRVSETLRLAHELVAANHTLYLAKGWALDDMTGNHASWFQKAGATLRPTPDGQFLQILLG